MAIGTAALALCMQNAVAIYDANGRTVEVVCFPDPNGVNGGPGLVYDVARNDANDQLLLSNIDFRIVEWSQSSTLNLLEDDYETFFSIHGLTPDNDYGFGTKPFYWVGSELWVFVSYEPGGFGTQVTKLLKFDAASRALTDVVTIGPAGSAPWAQASWDNVTFYWVNQQSSLNSPVNNVPGNFAGLYRWTVGDTDATFVANLSALVARDPTTFAGDIRTIAMRGPNELVAVSEGGQPGPPFLVHPVVQCFDVSGGGCVPTARYEYGDMVTSGTLPSFYPKLAAAGHQNSVSVFGCAADARYVYVVDEGGGEIYRIDRNTDSIVLWNQDLYSRGDVFAKGAPVISTGPNNGTFLGLNVRDFAGYAVPFAPDSFRLWPPIELPNLLGELGGVSCNFDL